jgi:uncharacterized protein YbjT (DUF2867 family)
MNILIFGATGMLGHGALRECVLDPAVTRVVTVGRRATGKRHAKLEEIVVPDVSDLSSIESQLTGFDATLFCLGVSSAGMSEAEYTRLTYDLTMSVATTLARLNPSMTFIYVSGKGTDETGTSRQMWARVKGRTENALRELPFKAAYMFRPGFIVPLDGIRSRTPWVQRLLTITRPFHMVMHGLFPTAVTTTRALGRTMLSVAQHGYLLRVLEGRDFGIALSTDPERSGRV